MGIRNQQKGWIILYRLFYIAGSLWDYLPYIICRLFKIIAYVIKLSEIRKNWLISFTASIFSLPVVFIFYTLYNSGLNRKTTVKYLKSSIMI